MFHLTGLNHLAVKADQWDLNPSGIICGHGVSKSMDGFLGCGSFMATVQASII